LEPDFVLISHADNDHVGGNRALREAHPGPVFACHELDRRWAESPGHTPGHIGLWDEHTQAAIIIDAVLADGIYDRARNKLIPPRNYDLQALRETIDRLEALRPELLLTAHYPVLDRTEALDWLTIGRALVDDVERVVREAPVEERDDLWVLTQRVDAAPGPFPQFTTELGATVREAAH
jgi:glyoxylase-like metal-dependent hydrolase (beta-lactamase superfamily II)